MRLAAVSDPISLDWNHPPAARQRTPIAASFLGRFRVAVDRAPVPLGTSRRTRALLAYLIDRGGRPVPRDMLMDVFWPDSAPDAARNSLHVAMSGVRKALGRAWPGQVIECRGDTYRLSDELELWTDVAELERRFDRAVHDSARGRRREAIAGYEAALALYAGDFLEDDPYLEWALARREELRMVALTCAERLSELHLAAGDLPRTLAVSTRLLREEPCHEPVAYRLMVTYARLGQAHMALRQYDKIVGVLDRDLGVAPAPETVALADRIRHRVPV